MQLNLQYEHIKTDLIFNAPSYRWKDDPPYHFNIRYPQEYVGRNVTIPEGATYFRIWNANKFNGNVTFPNSINNLYAAFYNCYNFNSPVSFDEKLKRHSQVSDEHWVIEDTSWMFANCFNFDSVVRFPTYNGERLSEISSVNCYAMFANCYNMRGQIYNFPSYGDDYADCFYNCHNLDQELYFGDLKYLNHISDLTNSQKILRYNFYAMFANCYNLNKITINIPIFVSLKSSRGTLHEYDIGRHYHIYGPRKNTIEETTYQYMFANCKSIRRSPLAFIADYNIHNISEAPIDDEYYKGITVFVHTYEPDSSQRNFDMNFNNFCGLFYNCTNLDIYSPLLLESNDINLYPYFTLNNLSFNKEIKTITRRTTPLFNFSVSLGWQGVLLDPYNESIYLNDMFYGINTYNSFGTVFMDYINLDANTFVSLRGMLANIKNYYCENQFYIGTDTVSTKSYKGERFQRRSEIATKLKVDSASLDASCLFYNTSFKFPEAHFYTIQRSTTVGGYAGIDIDIYHNGYSGMKSFNCNLSSMFDNAKLINAEFPLENKLRSGDVGFLNSNINIHVNTNFDNRDAINLDCSSLFENFKVMFSNKLVTNYQKYISTSFKDSTIRPNFSIFLNNHSGISENFNNLLSINAYKIFDNASFIFPKEFADGSFSLDFDYLCSFNLTLPYYFNSTSVPSSSNFNNILNLSVLDNFYRGRADASWSHFIYLRFQTVTSPNSRAGSLDFQNAVDYFKTRWLPIKGMSWSQYTYRLWRYSNVEYSRTLSNGTGVYIIFEEK